MDKNEKITVIKIGSDVLVDKKLGVRSAVVKSILEIVGDHIGAGEKILLVSSGAVAAGSWAYKNNLDERLLAGLGQADLLCRYREISQNMRFKVAEILLSRPHLAERGHFLRLQELAERALAGNIVLIFNENDILVRGTDWSFGDNDNLAAALAIAFSAERLIILSNVDGLYDADPILNPRAKLVREVFDINAELMKYCGDSFSGAGRGGMLSKLKAARLCAAVGIRTQIINGLTPANLKAALDNEPVGTVFTSRNSALPIKNRERWLLAAKSSAASIVIDDGAEEALRKGKSLLAVGVRKIYGVFSKGELVEAINVKKEGIAIGVVDIDSRELEKASSESRKDVRVMHANNLIVFG